jgi:hypothetical protein
MVYQWAPWVYSAILQRRWLVAGGIEGEGLGCAVEVVEVDRHCIGGGSG